MNNNTEEKEYYWITPYDSTGRMYNRSGPYGNRDRAEQAANKLLGVVTGRDNDYAIVGVDIQTEVVY